MSPDVQSNRNAQEAQRRVDQACGLIASAYRLETLDPKATIAQVRCAIVKGAEQQAEDTADDVRAA